MSVLVETLEQLADADRSVRLPPDEVAALVARFGHRVRLMGRWNVVGDASLEIPFAVLRDAARDLGHAGLIDAIRGLQASNDSDAALRLIDRVAASYERYFRATVSGLQSSGSEAARRQVVRELFGG